MGQKFIIYSPPFSSSKRDLNVFPYENNTTVTFKKISFQPKINTGYTDVKMDAPTTIFSRKLNVGEDLIYKNTDGRDVMEAGEPILFYQTNRSLFNMVLCLEMKEMVEVIFHPLMVALQVNFFILEFLINQVVNRK